MAKIVSPASDQKQKKTSKGPMKKMSEYGRQLAEKQKVKQMYGLKERQFRRFFEKAVREEGAPGDNLLSFLESRLDNVLYRLKMAISRSQARQVVTHGHVTINGKKVTAPSYLVSVGDLVGLKANVADKKNFVEQVIDKRMKMGIKVPEWLELMKDTHQGRVLRAPERSDIQVPIEDKLIVELYSK